MDTLPNTRRDFLKCLGAVSAGLMTGTAALAQENSTPAPAEQTDIVPFHGAHQAGIITPVQKHIYFLVADLHSTNPNDHEKTSTPTDRERLLRKYFARNSH